MQPVVVINTVGLCAQHLPLAPRLQVLAEQGWHRPLQETLPAVTCTAQASMLTGKTGSHHGIVGNGWYWRDTGEVRFWLQSNRLIQSEPLYRTMKRWAQEKGQRFRCAKLFWWFNQGAPVEFSVTPKPHYGSDSNKIFDITGTPSDLPEQVKKFLGDFPFPSFWGPMAGLPSTRWIAQCAAQTLRDHHPELTLVYLPHLDYDTQREGPHLCNWTKIVGELDQACEPILDEAKKLGAQVWVVNEYTHVPVNQAILINQALRRSALLQTRSGPFGEMLDTFTSRAFAVCDHQVAHVYLSSPSARDDVQKSLEELPGVDCVYWGEDRDQIGLHHPRAGDGVLLAKPNAWFAYPYWLDDNNAPDFARTVNIHAKPGYDPCELFFDPKLSWPKGKAMWRLVQKKMGFRTLFDVVPLDVSLVKGSHGLSVTNLDEKPLLIGHGNPPEESLVSMTAVRDLLLKVWGVMPGEMSD